MYKSITQEGAWPAFHTRQPLGPADAASACSVGPSPHRHACIRAKDVCTHVMCARMPACKHGREWRGGSYLCLCVRCELLSSCISGFPLLQNPLKPSPLTFVSVPLPVSSVMWESSERHACKTRTHKHACMRAQIQVLAVSFARFEFTRVYISITPHEPTCSHSLAMDPVARSVASRVVARACVCVCAREHGCVCV